jgi:hypothetical protein
VHGAACATMAAMLCHACMCMCMGQHVDGTAQQLWLLAVSRQCASVWRRFVSSVLRDPEFYEWVVILGQPRLSRVQRSCGEPAVVTCQGRKGGPNKTRASDLVVASNNVAV